MEKSGSEVKPYVLGGGGGMLGRGWELQITTKGNRERRWMRKWMRMTKAPCAKAEGLFYHFKITCSLIK